MDQNLLEIFQDQTFDLSYVIIVKLIIKPKVFFVWCNRFDTVKSWYNSSNGYLLSKKNNYF